MGFSNLAMKRKEICMEAKGNERLRENWRNYFTLEVEVRCSAIGSSKVKISAMSHSL